MSILNRALFPPPELDPTAKRHLVKIFWPTLTVSDSDVCGAHYSASFQRVLAALEDLQPYGAKFAIRTFQDLQQVTAVVRQNQVSTQDAILQDLKELFDNVQDDAILRSVDLAVQLWLDLNVHSTTWFGSRDAWNSIINWPRTNPLQELITAEFKAMRRPSGSSFYLDPQAFTAAKLKSVCRIQIRWTWNLQDHLRLEGRRGERLLSIYQHKICLVNHSRSPLPIIGTDIIHEALQTLDLLFPLGDLDTETLLRQEGVSLHSISKTDYAPNYWASRSSTSDFVYWRARLEQLVQLLRDPPETVVQTLLDRRNLHQ